MNVPALIGEIARRHNVLVSVDEPVFVGVTLNELLLAEHVRRIEGSLERAKASLDALSARRLAEARWVAEHVVAKRTRDAGEQVRMAGRDIRSQLEGAILEGLERTDQTLKSFGTDELTGTGTEREGDEYRVHPNVIRELARGKAIVKVDQPWVVDLVRLDHLDTSRLPPFEPVAAPRTVAAGLQLRERVREAFLPSPKRPRKPGPDDSYGA
jgi:hypothetical protein